MKEMGRENEKLRDQLVLLESENETLKSSLEYSERLRRKQKVMDCVC